jgi:glycosyltransferase involved in cell wall biosynthesis
MYAILSVRVVSLIRLLASFGGAFKADGDIFHVHYALQDAYLTLKLNKGKPVIVHAHGSDVRSAIESKKWGWIARYNLKHAAKLLLSAPDVLEKAAKFRLDVVYVPIPVDLHEFPAERFEEHGKVVLFHPYLSDVRGTRMVIHAFAYLQSKYPGRFKLKLLGKPFSHFRWLLQSLHLKDVELIESVPHNQMGALYCQADVVITDMAIGALPTSVEAMACGRPLVQLIRQGIYEREIEFPPFSL